MKVLVIGYGSIGKRHYNILCSILGIDNVFVVSKRDISIKNHFYSITSVPSIKYFDYFVIASKTFEHYSDLVQLNNLVENKIILVEKPLFHQKQNDLNIRNKIIVAYNLRFHPLVQKVKTLLSDEIIVTARFYAGQYLPTWRPASDYRESYSANKDEGGGILLDYSHDIDLLYFLLSDIEYFEAYNGKISDLDITSDDYLTMIGITKNKANFSLTIDSISKFQKREIQINTNNFSIEIDLINNILNTKYMAQSVETFKETTIGRNTTFELMHKDIIKNDFTTVASYKQGLSLSVLFDEIRDNSKQKSWI